MKLSKLAITFAMAGSLTATQAFAESGLQHPASVQQTGFESGSYDYYAADEKPAPDAKSDAAPAVAVPASSCGCSTGGSYNSCKDCELDCPDQETCRLFDDCCCLKSHGAEIRGWVNGGIMFNGDNPANRFNGPDGFVNRDSEFGLNQLYMLLEKVADTEGCGWAYGYRVDLTYGTDSPWLVGRGLDAHNSSGLPKWNSDPRNFYALSMPQVYGELAYNDVSVKIGRFYTIIGYEVVTAPDNFFYSHAYTTLWGEPFTHTGALASWKANDQLTLMGGITNGWNNFDDVNDHQSFLGGAILKSSDEDTSLAVSLSTGVDSFTPPTAEGQRTLLSTVFSRNLTDRLTYVFQNDTGWQQNAFGNGEVAEWYGINQYLFYKINCCWSAGVRAEWFRDDDGYVVGGIGNIQGMNPPIGGFAGDFYEVTLGLNWKPNGNFIFRPEVKWDWYDGLPGIGGTQPYVDGTDNTQFLAGFDLIYLF